MKKQFTTVIAAISIITNGYATNIHCPTKEAISDALANTDTWLKNCQLGIIQEISDQNIKWDVLPNGIAYTRNICKQFAQGSSFLFDSHSANTHLIDDSNMNTSGLFCSYYIDTEYHMEKPKILVSAQGSGGFSTLKEFKNVHFSEKGKWKKRYQDMLCFASLPKDCEFSYTP